jgi:hypothetical protein
MRGGRGPGEAECKQLNVFTSDGRHCLHGLRVRKGDIKDLRKLLALRHGFTVSGKKVVLSELCKFCGIVVVAPGHFYAQHQGLLTECSVIYVLGEKGSPPSWGCCQGVTSKGERP